MECCASSRMDMNELRLSIILRSHLQYTAFTPPSNWAQADFNVTWEILSRLLAFEDVSELIRAWCGDTQRRANLAGQDGLIEFLFRWEDENWLNVSGVFPTNRWAWGGHDRNANSLRTEIQLDCYVEAASARQSNEEIENLLTYIDEVESGKHEERRPFQYRWEDIG